MIASNWIKRFAPLVPEGQVLDLACGGGRHGRLFVEHAHSVLFVDIDTAKVQDLTEQAQITVCEMDLEDGRAWPFEADSFAAIVVTNYLYRPHLEKMLTSLKDGGVLLYETFAAGNERFGKPSNPKFLLKEGELLELVRGKLQVIAYEHGQDGDKVVQRICAVKSEDVRPIA